MRLRNFTSVIAMSAVTLSLLLTSPFASATEPVRLAAEGEALLPVVVADAADTQTQDAAEALADVLHRITGATFSVTVGDGTDGITVGTLSDFPNLDLASEFDADGLARREQYLLRTHSGGVHVIAADPLGVRHGVWDLLHRIGYRQYFPAPAWEVVPSIPELTVDVNVNARPDYYTRRIWYTWGLWDHNTEAYRNWQTVNRGVGGFQLRTGHAYGVIYQQNQEIFDANPDYFAMVDDVREYRGNIKFCLSNPDVRALIVNDRRDTMSNELADSISMDPSDGGGWCECDDCAALGSISDQALGIANEVAAALVADFGPGVYVGMYAYNDYSPPPNITAHPNVIVSIATSFLRGGYTLEQLIEGWSEQTATLGIREYYSINTWDRDLPGQARGSNLDYLAETIPYFHSHGVRYMSAESSDNWAPNGLGYYFAQRMLWDTDEANRLDELVEDFLLRAFGDAREPMRQFYDLINGANRPLLSDDLLGRLYRQLDAAWQTSGDSNVRQRIDDLTLWVYYVELFRQYAAAQGRSRQEAFEQLIRHAYRMRDTMLVHTKGLYRDLVKRDHDVTIPEGAEWNVPENDNPWKDSRPFTRGELDQMRADGIASHDLLNFEPVSFSSDLVPAAPMLGVTGPAPAGMYQSRNTQVLHLWVPEAPATVSLDVTGGLIEHYRDRGDVVVRLYPTAEPEGLPVAEGSTAPDGETRTIDLPTSYTGHHRIEYSDGNDMTRIEWPEGFGITFELGAEYSARFRLRQTVYFYVPKGTEVVGGYISGGRGSLRDSTGETRLVFDDDPEGFFEVPVPEGQDGKLWRLYQLGGQLHLMTVPPQVSNSPQGLLLPREVVEADATSAPAGQ